MAAESGDAEDRTEAATPRRLERARQEGQIPLSREAVTFASLAAVTAAFMAARHGAGHALNGGLPAILARPDLDLALAARAATGALMGAALPFAAASGAAAIAATLLQTRGAPRTGALTPDFSRLSPRQGIWRIFGSDSLVETLKSLAKLAVVGLAVAWISRHDLPVLMALPAAPLAMLTDLASGFATRLLLTVLAVQAVIAGIDGFWIWRQHQRRLRMSRSDIKDEQKETDGDPAIKMRIRRLRMRRARQRMLAAVPKATVVVTNPTHYAVALTYDSAKSSVPILVAKGVDSLAARIRQTARDAGVPIVENPPLARALHQLPLDARIPPELYKVVAELIAYVWRLSGRRP